MTLKVLDRKSAHARSIAYWPPAHWCMLLYVRWQTQRRVLLSTINFHLSPHSHTQKPHKTPLATRVPGIEARCECFRHTKAVCMNLRALLLTTDCHNWIVFICHCLGHPWVKVEFISCRFVCRRRVSTATTVVA